jgi:hypothetical protein
MNERHERIVVLGVLFTFATFGHAVFATDGAVQSRSLKTLRKIYLVVHPLHWVDVPEDDPRRFDSSHSDFPGRWELSRNLEFQLQIRYQKLIRDARDDEGMFFLPTLEKSCDEFLEMARKHFGSRLVALEDEAGYKFDCDMPHIHKLLGPDVSEALNKELEEDRLAATKNRGEGWEQADFQNEKGLESTCWEWSKTQAWYLKINLEKQGYTFDPATVEFEALGENWSGCAATFPIGMGRAWGLAKPIARRFDLINPDGTLMLLMATVVDQNLPIAGNIRLFIFKTADEPPTSGRYVAQFWEGIHGVMDRPRLVEVDFPPGSVVEVTNYGTFKGRALGVRTRAHGRLEMRAGYGSHFFHPATWAMALDSKISLEEFRVALLAGKVKELPKGQHP